MVILFHLNEQLLFTPLNNLYPCDTLKEFPFCDIYLSLTKGIIVSLKQLF